MGAWIRSSIMADDVVDLGAFREAKEKAFGDCIDQRQRILRDAIKQMRKFSTYAEIVKTMRFAIEVLERRKG